MPATSVFQSGAEASAFFENGAAGYSPARVAGAGHPADAISGHHAEIAKWRRKQALARTQRLLAHAPLSQADRKLLAEIEREEEEGEVQ